MAYMNEVEASVYKFITDLLQNNLAAPTISHTKSEYDFNPDVAKNRRALYFERNGYRGSKFIESIGVGIDGKEEQRRNEQRIRDEGRLNGEHYRNFPPNTMNNTSFN